MPRTAGTPCRAPGCTALSRPGSGYCQDHSRTHSTSAQRGSSTEQGYGATWRKFRLMQLRREPLCEDCLEAGRVTEATDVHHIVPKRDGGEDSFDNVKSLCHSCHSKRTAKGE